MTLRAFFSSEAADCIERMDRAIEESGRDNGIALERSVRALAGVARLGEHTRLYVAATTVVTGLRGNPMLPVEQLRLTLDDFQAFLAESEPATVLDSRLSALKARWGAIDEAEDRFLAAPDPEFLRWVADETAAIADCMEAGVQAFMEDPSDRERLGTILRRQRPLLGAARLPEIAIVGEALHAVEDLAAMIVRLDVPIKMEWLDVFRSAREVLRAASASLARGERPEPVNALSRLRTLRNELTDRYAARVASAAAAPAQADEQAVPLAADPYQPVMAGSAEVGDVVEGAVAEGRSALERALELRPVIDAGADRAARSAVAQLYEILRESLE